MSDSSIVLATANYNTVVYKTKPLFAHKGMLID